MKSKMTSINKTDLFRMGASINQCLNKFKNPSVLFFYKGTSFPQVCDAPDLEKNMIKSANDMIILGMRMGVSMEQQKIDYKEQLDLIEETFCDISKGRAMDENTLKAAVKILKAQSVDELYAMWCLNICALLKMKVIKDDCNNGILSIKR